MTACSSSAKGSCLLTNGVHDATKDVDVEIVNLNSADRNHIHKQEHIIFPTDTRQHTHHMALFAIRSASQKLSGSHSRRRALCLSRTRAALRLDGFSRSRLSRRLSQAHAVPREAAEGDVYMMICRCTQHTRMAPAGCLAASPHTSPPVGHKPSRAPQMHRRPPLPVTARQAPPLASALLARALRCLPPLTA